MSEILDTIRERSSELSPTFGDGWLTRSASDLVRIAVVLAGFDRHELIGRLARQRTRGALMNARTVERVMAEITEEHARRDELALLVWFVACVTPSCAECGELMFVNGNGRDLERASDYGNGRGTICTGCAASHLRPDR